MKLLAWQEALNPLALTSLTEDKAAFIACAAALAMRPLRTLGWDIGLTPEGPVMLEANRWWDPPNESVVGPAAPGVTVHERVSALALLEEEASRLSR